MLRLDRIRRDSQPLGIAFAQLLHGLGQTAVCGIAQMAQSLFRMLRQQLESQHQAGPRMPLGNRHGQIPGYVVFCAGQLALLKVLRHLVLRLGIAVLGRGAPVGKGFFRHGFPLGCCAAAG